MKSIFVSSTFLDMHFERDAIREISAPLINAEARQHNDSVEFCDLRWGINTKDLDSKNSSEKVLEVCLDEIDRSDPPMVVILGYHYGWIPDKKLILSVSSRKALQLKDLEYSVTALEIEYGALCDPAKLERTLFYFREIEGMAPEDYLHEDSAHAEKLKALKARILAATKGRVRTYTVRWNGQGFDGIKEFAETLADDVKASLLPCWNAEDGLSSFEKERRAHEAFITEKAKYFHARKTDAQKLFALALNQSVTIIRGEPGSGKTILFCHLAKLFSEAGISVLPFITGLTACSCSSKDIIENTVYWLEDRLGLAHFCEEVDPETYETIRYSAEEWRGRLSKLLSSYSKKRGRLIVMVDAADRLLSDAEYDTLAFIPNTEFESIHFLLTCTPDLPIQGRDAYLLMPVREDQEKKSVISGSLAPARELSPAVMDAVLRLKSSGNPLYLSLLVQRLQMMDRKDFAAIKAAGDGMSAIEERQLHLVKNACPDGLEEMSVALLDEAGSRIDPQLTRRAAGYISVSRNGLRRKDLSALLGESWADLDFAHLVHYMQDCFVVRQDGCYDFAHESLRSGFLKTIPDISAYHHDLMAHFRSLPEEDSVRLTELAYHMIKSNDKAAYIDMVESAYSTWSYLYCLSAAESLYLQSKEDDGKWAADLIRGLGDRLTHEGLQAFFRREFYSSFGDSAHDNELFISIYNVLLEKAEYLYRRDSSEPNRQFLVSCYESLAEAAIRTGYPNDIEKALEYYRKVQLFYEQRAKESDGYFDWLNLSICYSKCAEIYEEFGGDKHLGIALELCQDALEIRERLAEGVGEDDEINDLGACYSHIGRIYEKIDAPKTALPYYQKALELAKQVLRYRETYSDLRRILFKYTDLASAFEELGGSDDLDQALAYSLEALKTAERLAQEYGKIADRRTLMFCYSQVAGIHKALRERVDPNLARDYYRRALTLAQQLANELQTPQAYADLAAVREEFAGLQQ